MLRGALLLFLTSNRFDAEFLVHLFWLGWRLLCGAMEEVSGGGGSKRDGGIPMNGQAPMRTAGEHCRGRPAAVLLRPVRYPNFHGPCGALTAETDQSKPTMRHVSRR